MPRALSVLSLSLFMLCGCRAHKREPISLGYEWLSWTPEQRQLYVGGFLDGQNQQIELCEKLDWSIRNLKLDDDVRLEANEMPCQHFVHKYTHSQVGDWNSYTRAYVSVIDDFYKHPECRVMPYAALMDHLNDKEYQSGEELFRTVQTSHGEWGSFSGFEEMRKCYGALSFNK